MNVGEIIKKINTNDWVIFALAVIGFAEFIISVYVSVKAKSISKILKIRKARADFNLNRETIKNKLESYRDSIDEDNDYSRRTIHNILGVYLGLERSDIYNDDNIFNSKDRKIIKSEIRSLKSDNIDFRKTSRKTTLNLTHIISRLNREADLDD